MSTEQKENNISLRKKIAKSLIELEQSSIIELFEFYFDINEEPFRFHAGTNNLEKDIIWQGEKYYAIAIELEGFEVNGAGRLPRPKVTVANVDYAISNILRDYSDFRNGKFIRIKTFLKYLDNENFDDNENPFGSPDPLSYISKEKFLVSQKLIENKQIIQFELITPFDLESLEVSSRAINGKYCYWQYRGMGCQYEGDLICMENDKNFSVLPLEHIKDSSNRFLKGNFNDTISKHKWKDNFFYVKGQIVYIDNIDLNGFKDPPKTWFLCSKDHFSSVYNSPNKNLDNWEKDGCSKTISACKKRFSKFPYETKINGVNYSAFNDARTLSNVLPFGGFPGTNKFNYE